MNHIENRFFVDYNPLLLCSRDILIGDRCFIEGGSQIEYVATKDRLQGYFKVIGKISSNATWVKKGDEIHADNVRFEVYDGGCHVFTADTYDELITHGYYEAHKDTCEIICEIRGCCSYFH